ncbi:MAG: GGDEF domain-containing protein [Spirochaetota bacterium]
MTKKKILIVDDDPVNSYLLSDVLTDFDTVSVGNIHDMHQLIRSNFIPDLILLDVMLPEVNGFEAAHIIRNEFEMRNIPIVFVSAKTEGSSVRKGFESGAIDYIKKPFENDELFARIYSVLERIDREKKLIEEASTDPLTGLCNRRYFFSITESKISFCQRKKINLSIAILDIDHFKRINDTYSHICGDAVLTQFASILRKEIRDYDVLARYGGEEFILSFLDCSRFSAASILTRLQETIKNSPFVCDGIPVTMTFSAGITDLEECSKNCDTLTDYIRIADARLYQAKEAGRDSVVYE